MNHSKFKHKPNIAIIIPGGIGTGHNNIGVPVLERIIKLLSADFNLTVFQLYKINKDFKVDEFELIDIYSRNKVLKSITLFFAFLKVHRKRRFQTIHGFWALPGGFLAVLIGKIFKIKSIVSILGGDAIALPEINYGQLQNSLNKKLILWTLHQADEVTALTQYLVDNLKKAGLRRRVIKIIPFGVDTNQFEFYEKSFQHPIHFLHIANLHPVKDQKTLLKAFKIISDATQAQLTIIGEGISAPEIQAFITNLNLQDKVTSSGLLPYEDLPAYYKKSDVLLLTSLSEGQGVVMVEAMSSGVVVCGTHVGLLYDLPGCCISVPVQDHELLALKILQIIQNPAQAHIIRQQAHKWAKEHSISWTVENIKKLYLLASS